MLLLDRAAACVRRAIRALAGRPRLFAGMLAMHVGELSARDFLSQRAGSWLANAYLMMKLMRLFVPLCVSTLSWRRARPSRRSPGRSQSTLRRPRWNSLSAPAAHGPRRLPAEARYAALRAAVRQSVAASWWWMPPAARAAARPAISGCTPAYWKARKYPEIVFRPDRVDGKVAAEGRSEVQVHGVFAIHGVEHEMLVPAR